MKVFNAVCAMVLIAGLVTVSYGATVVVPPTKADCDDVNSSANGYKSDAEEASAKFIAARTKFDIRYNAVVVKYLFVLCNLTAGDKAILEARMEKVAGNADAMNGYVTLAHDTFGYGLAYQKTGTGWYNESIWSEALTRYQSAESNFSNAKTQYNNAYGQLDTTLLDDMEAILANY